ncbi:MAG TPA: hypothetical protein VF147_11140 [Vicinamibacterales bacterium]
MWSHAFGGAATHNDHAPALAVRAGGNHATARRFGLSHRGFEVTDASLPDDRFDFGDTDFEGGVNVIAGARKANGMFMEMRATAYGVSNVRLLVGYDF